MIYNSIKNYDKYDFLKEKFDIAYEFLKREDLADLPVGSIELGRGVKALIQHYTTIPESECKLETHDKYFDIQHVITGKEFFGVIKRAGLEVMTEYNEEKDVTFYKTPNFLNKILITDGEFVVVSPEEAHLPKCFFYEPSFVKKAVIKIQI